MCRWAAASFADANSDPRGQQLQVVLRQTAQGRHKAPQSHCHGDDVASIAAICPARNGNACCDVEDREGKTGQQTQLAVG